MAGEEGNIVNEKNEIIGTHSGLVFYTLGQRQGLGIGGVKGGSDLPWYVAKKNLETNELTCVQGNDHPLLFSEELTTSNQFLLVDSIPEKFTGTAKVRYRQKDQDCIIEKVSEEGMSHNLDLLTRLKGEIYSRFVHS